MTRSYRYGAFFFLQKYNLRGSYTAKQYHVPCFVLLKDDRPAELAEILRKQIMN